MDPDELELLYLTLDSYEDVIAEIDRRDTNPYIPLMDRKVLECVSLTHEKKEYIAIHIDAPEFFPLLLRT